MRSDPETLKDVLTMLDLRLKNENAKQANEVRDALANLGLLRSNEDLSKTFWPLLASRMAGIAPSLNIQTLYMNLFYQAQSIPITNLQGY